MPSFREDNPSADMPSRRKYTDGRKRARAHSELSPARRENRCSDCRKRICEQTARSLEDAHTAMTGFVFDAIRFRGDTDRDPRAVRLPDARNFISPPWPVRFWAMPAFTHDFASAEIKLAAAAARNAAAAAAVSNLKAVVDGTVETTARRLEPLERGLAETAAALDDLDRAAAAAEEADAASDAATARARRSVGDAIDGDDPGARMDVGASEAVREVQVTKNDPKLRYDTNLSTDMLLVVYSARGASGSAGVSMGTWYRTLQDTLIAERPVASRRIDYQNGRMSRTFVAAVVASLQAAGRSYVGSRHYTALEAAVLCLYAFSAASSGAAASSPPGSFEGVLAEIPTYLDELAESMSTTGGRPRYVFDSGALPKATFAAPGGGRYERDALSGHSVLSALTSARVLPVAPGVIPKEGASVDADAAGAAYDDRVNRAAAAILGRAQTLFLMEDQTLLRGALDTITALLLLRRMLWNTNVYAEKTANSFQLGSLLPTGSMPTTVGASASGPKDAFKSDGRNFSFLVKNYCVPLYSNDTHVELTQMFPGLVAVCLEAAAGGFGGQTRGTRRRVLDVAVGRSQAALLKLVGLELENRGKTNVVSVREVIETHDAVTLQYERGLGNAMQSLRPRESLFESGKASAFNASSDYDLHYFLCLGYIPTFTSAI